MFGISKGTGSFQAQRVVLYGLGGSGKTESAIRFAERHRQEYSAVFWVHGADEARLHDGFETIGRIVFNEKRDPATNYVNEAKVWFTGNSGWLLIVDNVNDESALDELRRKYLKGGMIGHVLLTSRNPTASAHWNGVEIADMEHSEAVELLRKITGYDCRQESQVLVDLLSDLGHLPLAIDQASSYIASTEISLKEYYEGFQIEKARLLRQLPSTLYNYDSRETVMTTWEISFKRIEQVNMPASNLLLMMAVFSHDDTPIDILELTDDSLRHWASNGEFEPLPENQEWVSTPMRETLQSRLRLREALLALKNFSFIRYKPGGKSFWLHPLVHYWADQRLGSHPTRQSLTMCSIGLVASSFSKEDRMPPFAVPYGRGDVASVLEEKSLRLWPWRQYKKLAPHAHHCMPYVNRLGTLPESMAHLSLSLLQVFEYLSVVDEPDETYRVHRDYAHDIIDHVTSYSEGVDNFLELSIVLWRLTRAVVCNCHKENKPCSRCTRASNDAALLLSGLEISQDALSIARFRAASLGLLLVLYLRGARLQSRNSILNNYSYTNGKRYDTNRKRYTDESLKGFLTGKVFFNSWLSDPRTLSRRMEQYIYNFYRYLEIRTSSELNKGCINHEMAEEATQNYERLCGRDSEEYRRSVWYLTTSLEDKQDWSQVQKYLEPLVRHSIDYPVNSWSHERCIIRLVNALRNMHKGDEAQQIMLRVQKAYTDAGKMLRSTHRISSLTPWHDDKVRSNLGPLFNPHHGETLQADIPPPLDNRKGAVADLCQNSHRKDHDRS